MCGIAGIMSFGSQPVLSSEVRSMCGAISHRGPDDDGFYFGNEVALGMRRLAQMPPVRVVKAKPKKHTGYIAQPCYQSRNFSNASLPLPDQATVTENDRYERGRAIQLPLYGDEIRDLLAGLPADLRDVAPRLLTEFCFGDFYTRSGLDLGLRELLVLCVLAALGGADVQVGAHAAGNLKAGNTVEVQIAAMIHCLPYIGFPRALNAIRAINQLVTSE